MEVLGLGSVSLGDTAQASCFGGMIHRSLEDEAIALLPEASAQPIRPDSWEERGMLTRRTVGLQP
jgi:hypothetical protein